MPEYVFSVALLSLLPLLPCRRRGPGSNGIELSELRQDRSAEFRPLPALSRGPEGSGLKSALLNSMAVLPDPPPARPSRGEGDMRRVRYAYLLEVADLRTPFPRQRLVTVMAKALHLRGVLKGKRSAHHHFQWSFVGDANRHQCPHLPGLKWPCHRPIIATIAFTAAFALTAVQEKRGHVPAVQSRAAPWTAAARRRFCFTSRKRRTLLNSSFSFLRIDCR